MTSWTLSHLHGRFPERERQPTVTFYMPHLRFGGAERVTAILAGFLAEQGWAVTLVLNTAEGELLDMLPGSITVHDLRASRSAGALLPLARYLLRERPDVLVSGLPYCSVAALLARALTGVRVPIVVAEHGVTSAEVAADRRPELLGRLIRLTYPRADAFVAVSRGAAADLLGLARLGDRRPAVIYNPVLGAGGESTVPQRNGTPADPAAPLFVAAGRLVPVKGFDRLLDAFALVRRKINARLLILGEGPLRAELEARRRALGLDGAVEMPGFVAAPADYYRQAAAVVVSSEREGFGNVLVEAMACGRPVISTDCPHGPAEILDGGRYGTLVPVGNAEAMATAMIDAATHPSDPARLRARAAQFSVSSCGGQWRNLLEQVARLASLTQFSCKG